MATKTGILSSEVEFGYLKFFSQLLQKFSKFISNS